MLSLGKNCIGEVEDFLVQNQEHLSTLMLILAQLHHLEKLFNKS